MKSRNFLMGIFFIVYLLLNNFLFAQNNIDQSNTTGTVYHIQSWNYNQELKDNNSKMNKAVDAIKLDFLFDTQFSYFIPINDNEFIIVSPKKEKIHIKEIQKHFQPYRIKVNTKETKELNTRFLTESKIPVYTDQESQSFKNQFAEWENNNQESIAYLKSLFK